MLPARFKYNFSVFLNGHLANPPWYSRLERRRKRGRAIRYAAAKYLSAYADMVKAVPEDEVLGDEPRRIFTLWMQGEDKAPALVRACLESIRAHSDCELVVLDENSLSDWISLPPFIMDKWKSGKMKAAHFADICRIELLYRHGGVWMDATDYLSEKLPEWLWKEDFFVYRSGSTLRGAYAFIQNCFIRGAKGAYLLKLWREAVFAYWKREEKAVDYFVHQLLFGYAVLANPKAASLFAAMPQQNQDPTHVLWHQYADKTYDDVRFKEICYGALFQKTDYKSSSARSPLPGSFADHLLRPRRRRLFLFAAFDPQGVISETALYYLRALKPYGDVRFVSDNPLPEAEKVKLQGLVCSLEAEHHGEYDFGSYKRAFKDAPLQDYDTLYLLNDSVIGPIGDLGYWFGELERSGADAFGLAWHPSRRHAHLQSWFIGLAPSVFRSEWFRSFLEGVAPAGSKEEICEIYETGFCKLLLSHGCSIHSPFSLKGKSIYDAPLRLVRKSFPFIKKASFKRHEGNMGAQLSMVMPLLPASLASAVEADFARLEGEGYLKWLLRRNPFLMAGRYLRYLKKKF